MPSNRDALLRTLLFALLVPVAWAWSASTHEAVDVDLELREGVAQATACQPFMHEDASEFRQCIDAVAQRHTSTARAGQLQQLGVYYFAWVAAMNSERLSLPGAAEASADYFKKFRHAQQNRGVDDRTLCAQVAGDCAARAARIRESG